MKSLKHCGKKGEKVDIGYMFIHTWYNNLVYVYVLMIMITIQRSWWWHYIYILYIYNTDEIVTTITVPNIPRTLYLHRRVTSSTRFSRSVASGCGGWNYCRIYSQNEGTSSKVVSKLSPETPWIQLRTNEMNLRMINDPTPEIRVVV